MRLAIAGWLVLSALYLLPLLHALLGYPLTRPSPTPHPNPAISFGDTIVDCPDDSVFDSACYRDIGRGRAYSFTLGGAVTPCDRAWRSALRAMGWGDTVQLSGPVPGKVGLCDWYQLRIVDSSGQVKPGSFVRAGARRSGQLPGEPKVANPDDIQRANVRQVGPPTVTIEKIIGPR